jgi:phospholipid N-methyltransferase
MTKQLRENVGAMGLFIQECLRKPKQMGAVAPSGPSLSKAMAQWLPDDPAALVLELGPGSGPVTEALLARGLRADRLIAIEKSPALVDRLRKRFPAIRVVEGDAGELDAIVHEHTGQREVAAVISSLPLRSFPPELVALISRKIHQVLKPGGCWVQFTYNIRGKHTLGSERFHLHHSKLIWLNLPPARVNVYQKRAVK